MERILNVRVVPVVVIDHAEDAVPLAEALLAGGLNVMETTFRMPAGAIHPQRSPGVSRDAGGSRTILDTDQLQCAGSMPVRYPRLTRPERSGRQEGLRAESAVRAGRHDAFRRRTRVGAGLQAPKVFPCRVAGGVKMLKALAGPYAHTGIKFIPLGGVNAGNAREYLTLSIVAAIGGSWMVERKLIAEKNWTTVSTLTTGAVQLAKSARA